MDAVHPRVLGFLGRALSLELSAVQQYLFQSSLAEVWGQQEAAARFRQETVEEMQHAEKIVRRMLALDVAPAASQLRPVTHAPDLMGLLEHNLRLENDLVEHYADALRFCVLVGDDADEAFFRELLNDERAHGVELAAWLESLRPEQPRALQRASL